MTKTVTNLLAKYKKLSSKYKKEVESGNEKIKSMEEAIELISKKYTVYYDDGERVDYHVHIDTAKVIKKITKEDKICIEILKDHVEFLKGRGLIDRIFNNHK